MYNNPYMVSYPNGYNQQEIYDRIDGQISQLQQMKNQMKNNQNQQHTQQPAINQTFQLAPNGAGGIRYVNSIEDVSKETIFVDTPFFSKDLSVLWIKTPSGDIKAYELNEIVQKDEKDLQIEFLMSQVNELKGMINNVSNVTNDDEPEVSTDTTGNDESVGTTTKKSKSTSIQRVSTSKKE